MKTKVYNTFKKIYCYMYIITLHDDSLYIDCIKNVVTLSKF